jgi:DNA-binding transcriptional ArsR family regulator
MMTAARAPRQRSFAVYALTSICLKWYILAVTATFEVLAQPHRRQILDLLLAGERPVGELVSATSLSQPAVSKHLRVLRDAGLVEARVEAQRRVYRLCPEPLRSMDDWLAPYRCLWATSLDALERHLADMDDNPANAKSKEFKTR